jgi:hypothetical protein
MATMKRSKPRAPKTTVRKMTLLGRGRNKSRPRRGAGAANLSKSVKKGNLPKYREGRTFPSVGNTTAPRTGIQPPPRRKIDNNPGVGIQGIIDIGEFLKSLGK